MSSTRVILPKLGLTMDEGKIVAWRKREGDEVAAGEILFEVETDKATMEVESPAAGFVRRVLIGEGQTAPVATVIAVITDAADEPVGDVAPAAPPAGGASAASTSVRARPSVSPASPADGDRVRSSPAARKRAQELGVDLATVAGTGPGGRVTIENVEAAASQGSGARSPQAAAAAPAATAAPTPGERRVPLTRMRRAIAEAMSRSAREVPQFHLSRDVDVTAADARRRQEGVSYTDVLVAASAQALRTHERFRSRFDGDAVVVSEAVNIGVAVALDDGLIVPVLRDADRMDLRSIAAERERLERGARAGKLPADALTGAVFSISNLGTLGVDRFQALVNPPEAAILAVGRVSARSVLTLTLSVDHRVADGADAARFLSDIAAWLETGGGGAAR